MSENFNPESCRTVSITHHGGGCCGVSHIMGFGSIGGSQLPDTEDAEKRVRYLIGKYWADSSRTLDTKKNRLYEAVLKDSQRAQWEPVLQAIGFNLVADWKNTNSGNRCFMYLYEMGPDNKAGPYKSPYAAKRKKKLSVPNPFAAPEPVSKVRY